MIYQVICDQYILTVSGGGGGGGVGGGVGGSIAGVPGQGPMSQYKYCTSVQCACFKHMNGVACLYVKWTNKRKV